MAAVAVNLNTAMSAAQAVGEFLQSPDDLLKVGAFRKKLEKEKASIDTRLKSGVKDQLDATREGLRKLVQHEVAYSEHQRRDAGRRCSV
jgi:exocyst complex component 3